ncbi:hypothetical protein [Arthrobacter sp. H14]|uniref:hypothetical protein n=1 Tax=Arthrobacter sp. H14 TaxID=1312959 RepID=UPI00047A2087|nr:hypothetical protein [Arthrobacter sp. H14]
MTSDPLDPRAISITGAWNNSRVVRPAVGVIGSLIAVIALTSLKWNDAAGTTGILSTRMFLVAYGLAAVVAVLGLVPADLWGTRESRKTWSPLPAWLHYLTTGVLIGVAIGITDWHLIQPTEATHLWWTLFMVMGLLGPQVDNRRIERRQRRRLDKGATAGYREKAQQR